MDKVTMHQDWDELEDDSDFWVFWAELQAYADQYNLTTRYVEEEFLIDGELVPVHLNYDIDEDVAFDAWQTLEVCAMIEIHLKE